jgi:hypothetical protein
LGRERAAVNRFELFDCRGRAGLVRGINPVGWLADVMYVASSENRSHGSSLGAKLRGLCNGTRFRYVFG